MAKRPSAQESTDLTLAILKRLPLRPAVSARSIHEQLAADDIHRDIRSIQRKLNQLAIHGLIEQDTRSKPYGYQRLPNHHVSAADLSAKESLLLVLAEEQLRHLLPAKLMKSMESVLETAKKTIRHDEKARAEKEWREKVRVVATTQPLLAPVIDEQVFEQVSEALYDNRQLTITYCNAGGEKKTKTVYPLGIAQQGTRLYLVCRFEGHNNERSVAMHRILSAKALTLSFERPPEFDLKKYDEDGRFLFGEGQKAKLTFIISRIAGQHLLESKLSTDQSVELVDDDHYRISATVIDSLMLKSWLRSFGNDVSDVSIKPVKSTESQGLMV